MRITVSVTLNLSKLWRDSNDTFPVFVSAAGFRAQGMAQVSASVIQKVYFVEDKKSIGSNLFWSKIRGEYDLRVVE